MINVTKPFLPPQKEYEELLGDIWRRNWLTNNGPMVNELELKLKEFLGLDHLLYLSNGTIAIQIAIKALELKGQIITTPFSYVATTSSIVWENCEPVFVDIDPESLCINPKLIEAAITPQTSGILATHVYGNTCDIDAIEAIAQKHNLKVIYDAAHAFGTTYKDKSVFLYGDVSTVSFHATKVFHTIEGGAVITTSNALTRKMSFLRNFGHNGPETFECVGINGKNSEFHALMGIVNLRYVADILAKRKEQHAFYDQKLRNLDCQKVRINPKAGFNYAYYPVILPSESAVLKAIAELNGHWIYPRRYFYPALNKLEYVKSQPCPVCEDISPRVLCLPLYHDLTEGEMSFISRLLLRSQNN